MEMNRFKILKLFEIHEEGFERRAIISFCKRPYLMQFGECIQYEKFLSVNLWFIIIELYWLTKIK